MNKQTIDKTRFFLGGISARIEESADFFENIEVKFTAGTKEFTFKAAPSLDTKEKKGMLEFIFCGEKKILDAQGVIEFVLEKMTDYEGMALTYNERGKFITVEANGKDVKTTSGSKSTSIGEVTFPGGQKQNISQKIHTGTAVMSNREYYIKPGDAQKLLNVIGIMGKNGKVKNDMIRKYNQIDHFVELIHPLLVSLCTKASNKRAVRIIDCACGKSYLSFVLNFYIKEVLGKKCYFTGLDYNPIVIEDSKKMAAELGYGNMEFVQTDIMNYQPEESYDLLLTLHACDTATDKALNFAMKHNVKNIVCVPCCHREMNSDYSLPGFSDIMKYGILKARIADSLTDGLRAKYLEAYGYDVSVVEYISPLDTPKNLMIRAERKRDIDYDKIKEFYDMCEMLGTSLSIGEW